jgi:hypothetical protein
MLLQYVIRCWSSYSNSTSIGIEVCPVYLINDSMLIKFIKYSQLFSLICVASAKKTSSTALDKFTEDAQLVERINSTENFGSVDI